MEKLIDSSTVIALAEEIQDNCSILELLDEDDVDDIPMITCHIRQAAADLIDLATAATPPAAEGGIS